MVAEIKLNAKFLCAWPCATAGGLLIMVADIKLKTGGLLIMVANIKLNTDTQGPCAWPCATAEGIMKRVAGIELNIHTKKVECLASQNSK